MENLAIMFDQIIQSKVMSIQENICNLNLTHGSIPPLLKYKIVFLGDQAVGKSSIINRFIYQIFDDNQHRPTLGIDFVSQNIFLEDKTIRLQLWDTAGQERFRSLIPNYIRDCIVAMIVYDITNEESFRGIQKWIDDVKAERGDHVIIALIANKIDLEDQRIISTDDGEHLANINQLIFKQVSAKNGFGVQQLFKQIASLLPQVNIKSKDQQTFNTNNDESNKQRSIKLQKTEEKLHNKNNKIQTKSCC